MEKDRFQIMQEHITLLERRTRIFYAAFRLMAVVMVIALVDNTSQASNEVAQDNKIIRARGLVIVDDKGRERILLGAPIPQAKNRVRTDSARV